MPDSDLGRFLELLERNGWRCQEIRPGQDAVWWKLSHVFPKSRRRIEVRIAQDPISTFLQLSFGVRPCGSCRAAVESYLMRLNNVVRLARFAIDHQGTVWLQAELSRRASSLPSLRDALDALRIGFDYYHREIELLAVDRELAEAWSRLSLPEADEDVDVEILAGSGKPSVPAPKELS